MQVLSSPPGSGFSALCIKNPGVQSHVVAGAYGVVTTGKCCVSAVLRPVFREGKNIPQQNQRLWGKGLLTLQVSGAH